MYHYELRYFYNRKKQGIVYVSSDKSLNDFTDEDAFLHYLVEENQLDAGLADQIIMIRAVTENVNNASSDQTDPCKCRCLFCRSKEFIRNPDGTLVCSSCGETYQELPEYRPIRLPRGTFRIVSGRNTLLLQKKGYGYSHECNGYTVLSNGTRAFAVSDEDYDRYYENKWAFCL